MTAPRKRFALHWMDPVWLLLGSGPRCESSRSVWVFLAHGRFAVKPPLIRVGFPWILSSESRLFNRLRGFSPEEYFARLFRRGRSAPEREPAVLAVRTGRIDHEGSLIQFLILSKELCPTGIIVRAVLFGRPNAKGASLNTISPDRRIRRQPLPPRGLSPRHRKRGSLVYAASNRSCDALGA
jgi:hypothetical protein